MITVAIQLSSYISNVIQSQHPWPTPNEIITLESLECIKQYGHSTCNFFNEQLKVGECIYSAWLTVAGGVHVNTRTPEPFSLYRSTFFCLNIILKDLTLPLPVTPKATKDAQDRWLRRVDNSAVEAQVRQ